jgi:two-component sensor histidine kinase
MSTFSNIMSKQGIGTEADLEWMHMLVGDAQLIADLSFADTVFWVPTQDRSFVALAHARPSGSNTLFYRDFVGKPIKQEWRSQVTEAYETAQIVESSAPAWYEETPTRVRAIPVVRRPRAGSNEPQEGPIAVITVHTNLSENRSPSRQEKTFNACADDILQMIARGDFPDLDAAPAPTRGAPRASDGLIRLDADGITTFASPNALSAFNRVGYQDELEGESLAEVTTSLIHGRMNVDESLPVVVMGRAPWRADIENNGVTMSLRAIPVRSRGDRTGAILLCRDVTELRHQERALITKDATIREIHHRVKNNLQTVASLLRIQARRVKSEEAKDALGQAMRRVASIALVHDALSEGLSQKVDFDDVFQRSLVLTAEVAATLGTTVNTKVTGSFGVMDSKFATPLAVALTELVTNAVEHGLANRSGNVEVQASRTPEGLAVYVVDDGAGLADGEVGDGLGTQIVKTLIEGELGGSISWANRVAGGTEVTIKVPMDFEVSTETKPVHYITGPV